jgi:hypothetical protein
MAAADVDREPRPAITPRVEVLTLGLD